jgi:hypothetical protein
MDVMDDRSRRLPAETADLLPTPASGENLVPDARAGLTLSQMVDRKLAFLLGGIGGVGRSDPAGAAQAASALGGHAAEGRPRQGELHVPGAGAPPAPPANEDRQQPVAPGTLCPLDG